jgi:hypothetical protein
LAVGGRKNEGRLRSLPPTANRQPPTANFKKCVERTCKPNSVSPLRGRGSFVCRSRYRGGRATYPNARVDTGGSIASLFGLAPQGVCRAVDTHVRRGALLPHRFTLTSEARLREHRIGGLFSVALSVASPLLAVSQPAARRSSDFPRLLRAAILRFAPRNRQNRMSEGEILCVK